MYTITGGRRLYKYEDGKYKFIKKDHVFEEQKVAVLIKPISLNRNAKNIYIEKELTFDQGSGNYKLINSKPTIEKLYTRLLMTDLFLLLLSFAITSVYESGRFDVPVGLMFGTAGLWVILLIIVLICRLYFKANYEQYARKLNDCDVVKIK